MEEGRLDPSNPASRAEVHFYNGVLTTSNPANRAEVHFYNGRLTTSNPADTPKSIFRNLISGPRLVRVQALQRFISNRRKSLLVFCNLLRLLLHFLLFTESTGV